MRKTFKQFALLTSEWEIHCVLMSTSERDESLYRWEGHRHHRCAYVAAGACGSLRGCRAAGPQGRNMYDYQLVCNDYRPPGSVAHPCMGPLGVWLEA